ncbi:hypothetical protein O2K51_09585 [Apibacter raozihei]|uniref:hypothetical protein n=1 Tax=Apibacter raozihei TaxID=2500547 RepID=UPI001E403B63|nr:hypothetical protein [Apibacter raozihei]
MKSIKCYLISSLFLITFNLYSQVTEEKNYKITAVNTFVSEENMTDEKIVRIVKDSKIKEVDEATFGLLNDVNFKNGTIEVKVLSKLLNDAPEYSRGFIGIAFRIAKDYSQFECIYIRPTNGRADDQIRRNHSIQYFAYPDYKYQRLRNESPEKYESYADMGLNEWIQLQIEVKGDKAKLYINNQEEPSLIVNDLKLGDKQKGGIGFFVDIGTEGFFKDWKIYEN